MKASHALLTSVMVLAACTRGEQLNGPRPVTARTPRAVYTAVRADEEATRVWDSAGSAALRSQLYVQPSFDETLVFPAAVALAATYRFELRRGERVEVEIKAESGAELFADVFEVIDTAMFRHVYAPSRGDRRFSYTATTDGVHVLRLQPPVGGGGRFAVHVGGSSRPGLTFPVAGASASAIAGQWGDARDGGARSHKGVDIFAPRGTPVLAVASGRITSVENTEIGGRVVWQKDEERGLMYYYAHLDEQLTSEGRRVSAGDTIGRVGNTGNASGGSTHLHFGVFRDGYQAENPTPWLTGSKGAIPARSSISGTTPPLQLGSKVRLSGNQIRLRTSPGEDATIIEQLANGTELLLLGSLNGWTRVVLADGTTGFIAGWLVAGQRQSSGSF